MTGVLIREEKRRFTAQQNGEETHLKIKIEFGVLLPQGKECQEPLEARIYKERFFPRFFGKTWPCYDTLILDFLASRTVRI